MEELCKILVSRLGPEKLKMLKPPKPLLLLELKLTAKLN
jgi:hypothetical protein